MRNTKKFRSAIATGSALAMMVPMLVGCGSGSDITWHYNNGTEDGKTTVAADSRVSEPEQPTNDGYVFSGWYEDEELTKPYVFGSKLTEDLDLYAGWEVVYTFEAEDVSFAGKSSPVFSGAVSGTTMIVPDMYGRNASNGYYVMGLYSMTDSTYDTTLEFNVVASEAMEDAKIYLRLSAAYADMTINGDNYQVLVNGKAYSYSDIAFEAPEGEDPERRV